MNSIREIVDVIQKRLKTLGDPDKIPAIAKYGITPGTGLRRESTSSAGYRARVSQES